VATEDRQDPASSRARQLKQAVMLVAGHGVIVAEFFDTGESRTLPWARRPAASLVAQLADPDRGWGAIANDRVTHIWAVRNPEKLRSWTATD
jgi:site-specific DNA recombinase